MTAEQMLRQQIRELREQLHQAEVELMRVTEAKEVEQMNALIRQTELGKHWAPWSSYFRGGK